MNPYISLYKKARKILDEKQVSLENAKENTYYFKVKEYDITLTFNKVDGYWSRDWTCSCASYALRQDKIRCAHVIAAETFLVINNGSKKN